jgi:hypothetical protein
MMQKGTHRKLNCFCVPPLSYNNSLIAVLFLFFSYVCHSWLFAGTLIGFDIHGRKSKCIYEKVEVALKQITSVRLKYAILLSLLVQSVKYLQFHVGKLYY